MGFYNKLDEIEKSIRKPRKKGGRRPFPAKAMANGIRAIESLAYIHCIAILAYAAAASFFYEN